MTLDYTTQVKSVDISTMYISYRYIEHPYSGGKMPSQGEDLAVLSLCNHSIIGVRRAEGWERGFGQNMSS